MAALTTPFAPAGVRGPTARAMSSRSISQRVPAAGARVQPRKVNVAVRAAKGSIREQAGRRGAYTPDVPSLDPLGHVSFNTKPCSPKTCSRSTPKHPVAP